MLIKVQKWGDSLAICIPEELAEEAGLEVGSEVEIRVVNGHLEICPPGTPHYTLEELVAQITPENRHEEWDTGPRSVKKSGSS